MIKNIFINATSATCGGSQVILFQFIDKIIKQKNQHHKYYLFVPMTFEYREHNNIIYIRVNAKSFFLRIWWDCFGLKKWIKKKNIKPSLIISLQNTGVFIKNIPQIIYLHQLIPYHEKKWNILNKDERKLWIYKNIYKLWIELSIKEDHYIFVQTNSFKQKLINNGFKEEKIHISRPDMKNIEIEKIDKISFLPREKIYFYPAADYKYKNHEILLLALKEVLMDDYPKYKDIKFVFTLDIHSEIYRKAQQLSLLDNILFIGQIDYNTVLKYYKTSHAVVFPSYIESFGLPLIEAACFGKKILVSNSEFSYELLNEYSPTLFSEHNNIQQWKESIIESYDNYKLCPTIIKFEDGWQNIFNLVDSILK